MKLSIITPVYNRADCILRCLESVTSQLEFDGEIEHVVVDDGSTDDTAKILRDYSSSHPHVKSIFFQKNRGTNAARNAAIKGAEGDFCVILDSDDYFTPDACQVIIAKINEHPDYRYFMFTRDDRTEEFDKLYGEKTEVRYEYKRDVLGGKVTGDYIHVIPRDVLVRYPFEEQLKIYESLIIQQIYREVNSMLFFNKTIVIAERDRSDSVTWFTLRVNENSIRCQLLAAMKELELFGDDYISVGDHLHVDDLYFKIVDNASLLGQYDLAKSHIDKLKGKRKLLSKFIISAKCAPLYRQLLTVFLKFKYWHKFH